jgi:hypothetical protein
MPAVSEKQQQAMAIAEHEPEKLFKRNVGLRKMTKKQLREFARTKRKGLPKKVKAKAKADKTRGKK